MPLAFLIVSLLGAGISAYSSYEQGRQANQIARMNADAQEKAAGLAQQQAELQRTQTKIAADRQRKETQRILSSQRVSYSKAGVDPGTGTPLLTAEDTLTEGEKDAMAIELAGSIEEANIMAQSSQYRLDAKMSRMRGSNARTAGNLQAGSSLLTGLGQFGSGYKDMQRAKV